MIIAGTKNAKEGINEGMKVLKNGGTAVDAVETAVRVVEDNPFDWSVGYGGFPNLLGNVELDAAIMSGKTLNAGAVAGITHYKHPISIARKVMEATPHVFLIGKGAEHFADLHGFVRQDLLTEQSKRGYERFKEGKIPILTRRKNPSKEEKEKAVKWMQNYLERNELRTFYDRYHLVKHGTVNVIAKDAQGNISVGVSTSGIPLKLPGRVGDTPIIGAGVYADNRTGGTACVGHGELSMRSLTAKSVNLYYHQGYPIQEACTKAISDLSAIHPESGITVLSLDKHENAYSIGNKRTPTYFVMDEEHTKPKKRKGEKVNL
ncbi:MAG: N(4)-(beta-N-acetylglucosaminyl)-L-asparaginase [Candidatus Korarchaeota archaeon]|nr:N(4)-(beta-N-acetylglucosaminyl)-L-asparaginase [Candidatus Korarchaeota archaeon]NIU84174.1 isoaspartyl peptidase [Candidatus Thorarchaeota archaeon]NIW14319.1 isoaspartyl peptidase [Candidatus Thorarchaeota archaeon]NIW52416.1 isoaspartyl peptidase [Candidatus Korarchaeota archaeon]